MKKFDKFIILVIGVSILFNVVKDWFFKKQLNEIVIWGHHVDKQPCVNGINDLFGKGVDSTKMCDCLLPAFYELIKDDPDKVKKFEEVGFFTLQDRDRDSSILIFRNCVIDNIVDTSYKLNIQKFKVPLFQKLRDSLLIISDLNKVDTDSLCNCIIQQLDKSITIKEYFADDYLHVDKLKMMVNNCIEKASKKN